MSRSAIEIAFRLSGSSYLGAPFAPEDSLGGFVSSGDVYTESTVTASADVHHFTDSAQIGEDLVGSWVIPMGEFIITIHGAEPELNEAREVVAFNTGTGEFTLGEALPVALGVGHFYRLCQPGDIFNAIDGPLSVSKADRFRLCWLLSLPNGTIDEFNIWIKDVNPGPLRLEVATATHQGSSIDQIQIPTIVDEFAEPDITTTAGGLLEPSPASANVSQVWGRSPANHAGDDSPRSGVNVSGNKHRPIWLRLSWLDAATLPRPQICAFQVVADGRVDQDFRRSSFMVVVQIDGPTIEYVFGPDRKNRIEGGSKVQAQVRDADTKIQIPNYTAVISLDPPSPGTLHPQNQEETSDDGVIVQRVYESPTDPGEVGSDVDVSVEVF